MDRGIGERRKGKRMARKRIKGENDRNKAFASEKGALGYRKWRVEKGRGLKKRKKN